MAFYTTTIKAIFCVVFGHLAITAHANTACRVFGPSGVPVVTGLKDPLFELLGNRGACPKNVLQLRDRLHLEGAEFSTSMVANRGFHNPSAGSFSFFETVTIASPTHLSAPVDKDQLFLGHFTTPRGNNLTLDQNENAPGLMVEAMAWDTEKEVYNFYELVGSPHGSRWFYRGDSSDVWRDVSKLHRKRSTSEPTFGSSIRCSGCHVSGGPIMKELSEPHDSWWREDRPLPLAGRFPDVGMKEVMKTLESPNMMRATVLAGLDRLMEGKAFKQKVASSPQIALRPLFCAEEVNLASSPLPLEASGEDVSAPSEFFVDARLLVASTPTRATKSDYKDALTAVGSRFPETGALDADHAWLSPVKAFSDTLAMTKLMANGTVDKKFVLDVLAVDMTRPVFSAKRCALLQLLPDAWSPDWVADFRKRLRASALESAAQLLHNMASDEAVIQARAARYLNHCSEQLDQSPGVLALVTYLGQIRNEISASEISHSPRGQILEPGFRVIFPTFERSAQAALETTLSEMCLVQSR